MIPFVQLEDAKTWLQVNQIGPCVVLVEGFGEIQSDENGLGCIAGRLAMRRAIWRGEN